MILPAFTLPLPPRDAGHIDSGVLDDTFSIEPDGMPMISNVLLIVLCHPYLLSADTSFHVNFGEPTYPPGNDNNEWDGLVVRTTKHISLPSWDRSGA